MFCIINIKHYLQRILKLKSRDSLVRKVKSQKKDRSPLLIKIKTKKEYRYPLKCTTLYIYEIESLFFINFYLQLFNYNLIIIIFKHLNFFFKYNKVLKKNIIQFLTLNFMELN